MSSPFIIIDEITDEINKLNTSLTTTINTINTNVNTANTSINAIKTNTAANSTESSTGTLSQKLAYLINRRDRIVTPSSTNIKTLFSGTKTATFDGSGIQYEQNKTVKEVNIGSWGCYMKHSGKVRVYVTGNGTFTENNSQRIAGAVGFSIYATVYDSTSYKKNSTLCTIEWYGSGLTMSSTTKTFDVYVGKGNYIDVNVKLYIIPSEDNCDNYNYYPKLSTLNITEVKICGTTTEVNGLTT